MKKLLIAIVAVIALVLLAAFLAPIIFKDDIQAAIDEEIDKNLKATVYYDTDHLELTLFKNFPNITVGMSEFGIVGIDQFSDDTLVSVGQFQIVLDIMSVISGDQIKIKGVLLDKPDIHIIVLEDGTANYDIAKDTGAEETSTEEAESGEPMSISIDNWTINEGSFAYIDLSLPFYTILEGLNHSGSGDFEADIFDMVTETSIAGFTLSYDGTEYITKKELTADITMSMDMPNATYTFKENLVKLNDFPLGFEGSVAMPSDDIDINIDFAGKEIDMKSILALIPGVYMEYMEGLDASGAVAFSGSVKGTYNENSMPVVTSDFLITDGIIKYADFPKPIEAINVKAKFDYPSADLRETSFEVSQFSMLLDGEKTTASLMFKDLEDYFWDLKVDSHLDLEKITKIVPLEEGMEVRGKINGKLNTSGRMSTLEAEKYDQLPTSGAIKIADFYFVSSDLPQGFGISEASTSFNPQELKLEKFQATIGTSDMSASGTITNYLGYALKPEEILKGKFQFSSNKMDLNQFMVAEEVEETPEEPADTSAMEPVIIPKNIDFVLNSSIKEIIYDNLTLKNASGALVVRDGEVKMDGLKFGLLDGQFSLSGVYSTADPETPKFDFNLGIVDLSIAQAYQAFSTVQTLAPVAEKMTGKFTTDFKIGGDLGKDMMPLYDKMYGEGLLNIAQAAVADLKLMSAVSSVSKLSQSDGKLQLNDVLMFAQIQDGRVNLKPFDVKLGGYKTNISGSNGIDGSLDYNLKMDVPNGKVGAAVNDAITSLVGQKFSGAQDLVMRFNVGGTYDDPKVKLAGIETKGGETVGSSVKTKVVAEVDKKKEEVKKEVTAVKDSVVSEGKEVVKETTEKAKEEVKDVAKDEVDKAKDKLKGLLKKKKGGGD